MPETKGRVDIDENGLCNICREREKDNTKVEKKDEKESLSYFKKKLLFHTKSSPKYDCIVSVSGGKDSMMTLYIAKKILNLRVLAVFVDNGFVLPEMYHNVNSASEILGIDLIIYKTNDFFDIFKKCILSKKEVYFCRLCHILLENVVKKICIQNEVKVILGGYTKGQNYIKSNELFWIYEKSDKNVVDIFKDDDKYKELSEIFTNPMAYMNKEYGNILQLSPFRYIDWNSSNCIFNYVAQYKALDFFGYSQHETELSDLVRSGEMNRDRALEIINTPLKEEHIVSALSKMGLDIKDI